jgi:hypothetical protein
MKSTLTLRKKFTLPRLIRFLLTQAAFIAALELYWRWQSGKWEATSLAVIPVFLWIYAALVYRWLGIMKELADGSFSDEDYQANPMVYMMGNGKHLIFVIMIGTVIGLICIAAITVMGLN